MEDSLNRWAGAVAKILATIKENGYSDQQELATALKSLAEKILVANGEFAQDGLKTLEGDEWL